MNNIQIWSKTLLTIYKVLPNLAKSIEETTIAAAMSGFSNYGDTYSIYDKIIKLNERKRKMINIKVIVDNCLEQLNYKSRRVLELKFFERNKFEDIALKTKSCIRTVFRRYDIALNEMCVILEKLGFDAEWLCENYNDDEIIKRAYNKVMEKSLHKYDKKCEKIDNHDEIAI